MRKILVLTIVSSAALLAAPAVAAPAAPGEQSCLRTGQIYSWRNTSDDRAVIVTDTHNRDFKVSLDGICQDMQARSQVRFLPFGGTGLSCLARGDTIVAGGDMGAPRQRCFVTRVEPYTIEMRKADAAAAQAKAHH